MPDAVKWLLPIVVGESWPEGDETKLRALRDAWHAASGAIAPVVDTGNQASEAILASWTGDAAQAYGEQWKKFVEGDEAFFKQLTDATKALGDSCDQTALDVEYTKYMIIISLVILAAQIIAMIASAAVTFGGSTAGIAPAQIATRMTVQMLFRQLLEKLAQQGFKQVAKELLEKLLKQGLKKIGMEVLKNEAMNLGMDAGIQGLQMAKGDRKDWDWSKTKDSAISGAVGGVVGAASGSIGKGATGALSHSAAGQVADSAMRAGARGAVEGVAQTVGQAAVTGKLGELTPEQLLMGASSGAVGGAVGGAKEQMKAIHEANMPHAEPGTGTNEPSSRDDSPEPESRRESSSEPESRSEAEPETRQEPSPSSERQESAPSSEPESRQESAPSSERQEVAPRHAPEAPESAPQRAPETADPSPQRAESGPAPSADHAPAPERPAAEHAAAPERPAPDPAPQPEHRAPPQQSDAPAQHSPSSPSQPTGGTTPAMSGGSGGSSSHGGYGMASNSGPSNFADPRQTGGRAQDNVGAAGFTGGQSVPPSDGGFGPAQPASAPPPQQPQAPPPGGMPPSAPGGMNGGGPRQGGQGPRPGGPAPQQPPMTPRPQYGDPRRTPQQDPRARQAPPPGGRPVPPQNGGPLPPNDPRRMPPQDPRNRPVPQGGPPQRPPVGPPPPARGPGGYPPRPPQGPHPGGRPPGPPQGPPGGRPMPPHDPRFGPPRPGMPPQVPGPRHGAPPPEHWQRGPQDRTPPQPQQHPMPPHEQPRPIDRAPEQPSPPQEQVPRQEHAPAQEQQAPQEHVPAQEQTPVQEHAPAQAAEKPHEPEAQHRERDLDERHLTDPDYRTTDPAGLKRIEETFIDSGFGRENPDEFRHEEVQRQALAKRDASHPGMTDAGAIAVHGYTRHELFSELNKAMRFGGPELADLTPQARALTSGLNELPPHVGTVSRRIRFDGDPARVDAFMARYAEGAHVVEPTFLSTSKVDDTLPRSKFAGEVEMRIESKTGRDIEDLASVRGEREVLFKGGTQLQVTHVEKGPGHPDNDPHGVHSREPQWIVHAEEIAPGDTRHLGAEDAQQAIDARREQERAIDEQHSRTNRIWAALGQEGPPPEPTTPVVDHTGPGTHEPAGGWSELAKPLTPGGEPVLHSGSVESPQQHARLLRDVAPGIDAVNTRNHYAPDALDRGYKTNTAESMVAFERRMNGENAVAAPDPNGLSHQQSLDHVGEQLGGTWSKQENFDGIARELGERPVGARTAVAYEEHIPAKGDVPAHVETRLVAAIKTEHGIVFADPASGRLATLPEHAGHVQSMPLGGGETPHVTTEHPAAPEHRAEPPVETHTDAPDRSITNRLLGEPDAGPMHDEGYLFDPEHHATPQDHESIGRTVGADEIFDRISEDALARRDASEKLGHLTDDGAIAIHTYTHEHAYAINEANRSGPGHPGFELAQQNTRAIMDGLQQVRPESGVLLRGVDTRGDHRVATLIADDYQKGHVAVETTLTSATIKTEAVTGNHFGDDVVLHIKSDNIRDISSISQNRGEGESISPPATQLLVHDKRLEIGPGGKRTWVIEAEEIGPGHPRHLDRETAEREMAGRRARHVENAQEVAQLKQQAAMRRLDGLVESPPHADHPTEAPPHTEPTPEAVHDVPDTTPEPGPAPEHGWSELSRATNPPSEPAIHADSASPEQRAAYVREQHPHLGEVNPHFHDPDALELGYRSNCVNGPESYWDRLHGGDMTADPLRVADMETRGTLDHIEGKFGERFSDRADYDAVIREMREMPVDHHAVVAVKYVNANGVELGHVAMVVHTRDGVAFIDPQSGDLMHLPQPPKGIRLMHVGVPDPAAVRPEHAPAGRHQAQQVDPRIAYADRTQPFPQPEVRPSRIGPDGRPMPSVAEHGGYGAAEPQPQPQHREVETFLARDDVAAALHDHPDAAYIREQLAHHPELARMMAEPGNEYLTRSLLDNPKTLASLLKHPEAIPILEDAVHEAHERGYRVIDDVHENGVSSFEPTPEQAAISAQVTEIADGAEPHERGHGSFDHSRMREPGYAESWVAGERESWPRNQGTLNKITERIAGETDGVPGFRPDVKDDVRALAKIAKYQGDGSRLTDLVGTKIQFDRVDNMYRALDALRRDPGLRIVSFDDRIQHPVPSGYRDLQLNVRLENGHVAELRLHLTHIDDVAGYEHALYEVRRDFETFARKEGRRLSPDEATLDAALTEQVRERFETAFQQGLPPEIAEENL